MPRTSTDSREPTSSSDTTTTTTTTASTSSGLYSYAGQMTLRSRRANASTVSNSNQKFVNKATMTNGGDGDGGGMFGYLEHRTQNWSLAACCCSKLFWLLLLLLVPFVLLASNQLNEHNELNHSKIVRDLTLDLELNHEALAYLWTLCRLPVDFIRLVFLDYLPHLFGLLAALFRSVKLTTENQTAGSYFVPDFKPATSGRILI